MAKKEFLYKSRFNVTADFQPLQNLEKKPELSTASLDDLRKLLPNEQKVEENPDLLYTAFNAAVANLINANDDGMMTDTALSISRRFEHKQINVEHNRNHIVGHVINHGFSSFGSNEMLAEGNISGLTPFNIALSGIVYRVADEYFAEYLEESKGMDIGASWEVGFDEFVIALGSKNLDQAEIIVDDAQVAEFVPFLKAYGGNGFTRDGVEVYRVITGEANPLGIGLTMAPAAAVRGLALANNVETETDKEELKKALEIINKNFSISIEEKTNQEDKKPEKTKNLESAAAETEIIEKNNSHSNKRAVNTIDTMKITKVEDIQQDKWEVIEASAVRDFIFSELDKANNEFSEQRNAAVVEKEAAEAARAEADEKLAEANTKLSELEEKFNSLKEEQDAIAAQATFNERMASIEEEYELGDADREVIAKSIKGLDDEAFSEWKVSFDVLASAKKKGEEVEEVEETVASLEDEDEDLSEELEEVEASNDTQLPPNSLSDTEEDKNAKLKKAFSVGEGVVIAKQ